MRIKRWVGPCLILLVPIILIYLNTLRNGFVWDDDILIVNNHLVKSWRHIGTLFTQSFFQIEAEGFAERGYYRPIIMLSYALDYSLWGLHPVGYHLTNILLHCLDVLLLYCFFARIFKNEKIALIAGLCHAISPVNTNSVAWIAGRTDLLATLFFLLALISYQRFRQSTMPRRFLLLVCAPVFFLLSLLCKESVATLPLILISYDICFGGWEEHGWLSRKSTAIYSFFLAVLAAYVVLRQAIVATPLDFAFHSISDVIHRFATIVVVIVSYWKLLFFPVGLRFDRTVNVIPSLTSPVFLICLGILVSVLILSVHWWKRNRELFFCAMWFFIAFLPVSNILPVFPSVAATDLNMGEQFMYLPSMGFYCLLGSLVLQAARKADLLEGQRWKRRLFLAAGLIVVFFFSILTIRRNMDWKNNLTFYERSLAVTPNSARIINNLGVLYIEEGEYQKALHTFERLLKIDPESASAFNNLGAIYEDLDLNRRAEENYRKALSFDERNIRARLALGRLLARTGRAEEAEKEFSTLITYYPGLSAAHHELGRLLMARNEYSRALKEFEAAIENAPNPDVIYNSIGIVYAKQEKWTEARRSFELAIENNPESYQAYVNLGNIYLLQGVDEQALTYFERALEIHPDLPDVRQRAAGIRQRLKKTSK